MLLLSQSNGTAIGERIEACLSSVEDRFSSELMSDLPCVNSLITHVERYRGKMLRPMLVLVAGMASSRDGEEVNDEHLVISTVVEMVHMATLVHDDVLDDAQIRRGGGTINHLKGNEAAVMLGDYLISHAYHLCSGLGNASVSRVIANATNTVCEGELLQLTNRGNLLLDERTYFEIVRRKTGSLCGVCCSLGAMLNGAASGVVDQFYRFGESVGVAFQVIDDLLDLVGAEDTVKKTLGKDTQKGKLTLPVIHYLKTASKQHRQEMFELLQSRDSHDELAEDDATGLSGGRELNQRIHELIASNQSIEYANHWAGRLIDQAKVSLEDLADSPAKSLLMEMADTVLTRKF